MRARESVGAATRRARSADSRTPMARIPSARQPTTSPAAARTFLRHLLRLLDPRAGGALVMIRDRASAIEPRARRARHEMLPSENGFPVTDLLEQRVDERRGGSASQEDQDPDAAEGDQDRQDPPLPFLPHEAEELPEDSSVRASGL